MKIEINNFAQGDTAISYDEGKRCYELIKKSLQDKEKVFLDFAGINYVIMAFLNPVIGELIIENGEDVRKKVEIENANIDILKKIKMVQEGAFLKRTDLNE